MSKVEKVNETIVFIQLNKNDIIVVIIIIIASMLMGLIHLRWFEVLGCLQVSEDVKSWFKCKLRKSNTEIKLQLELSISMILDIK